MITKCVSPDGSQLAVTVRGQKENESRIQIIIIDSGKSRRVINEKALVVAWSPDSTRLLLRSGKKYEWSNVVYELATGAKTVLPLPETDAVMDWSSDPEVLSVMAGRPDEIFEQRPGESYPKRQLYSYDLQQHVAELSMTHPDEDCIQGRFSSDASELVYSRRTYDTGKPVELCEILHFESQEHRTVVNFTSLGVRPNQNPFWSRDGRQLLWQVSRQQDDEVQWELWFLPTNGSAHRSVSAKDLGLKFFGVIDWR